MSQRLWQSCLDPHGSGADDKQQSCSLCQPVLLLGILSSCLVSNTQVSAKLMHEIWGYAVSTFVVCLDSRYIAVKDALYAAYVLDNPSAQKRLRSLWESRDFVPFRVLIDRMSSPSITVQAGFPLRY
jgi:hypothetical protein